MVFSMGIFINLEGLPMQHKSNRPHRLIVWTSLTVRYADSWIPE